MFAFVVVCQVLFEPVRGHVVPEQVAAGPSVSFEPESAVAGSAASYQQQGRRMSVRSGFERKCFTTKPIPRPTALKKETSSFTTITFA